MARSAANQLKIGSLLSYVQMFLGVIISLLYTPVMLRLLGKSEYGLYNTVSSTISMLSLLSLGFNSGYIRYYTRYKQNDDTESIWKLNGLFLIVFIIIGVIGLLCGIFLSFHLDLVFSDGLTAAEYRLANVLMILLSINLAISFPMSVFGNIISANERFVVLKAVGILKTVVGPLVTLPLLLMGYRAVAMVVVTLVLSGIADAVYVFYVVRRLHNRFVFHGFEKGLFADLFLYTAFISVNLVVDQINWNVDKIILGRMKGTGAVAEYSVGYTLFQYYMMFSTSISSVFTPRRQPVHHRFLGRGGIYRCLPCRTASDAARLHCPDTECGHRGTAGAEHPLVPRHCLCRYGGFEHCGLHRSVPELWRCRLRHRNGDLAGGRQRDHHEFLLSSPVQH